ncbi:MAG: LysR family transcriptional regulator [Proteobacteria bacterium]|nr:LysR family transcriptional regulator [Pseudomonadota bacterium]
MNEPINLPNFELIEALRAFVLHGTTAKAAVALRLSQAAISKRLGCLEDCVGFPILHRQGRNAVATAEALTFLNTVEPHMTAIRDAIYQSKSMKRERLKVALSESIALSGGAVWIADFQRLYPHIDVELHVHRAPVAIQNVASGNYDVAVTPFWTRTPKSLEVTEIGKEPLVLLSRSSNQQKFEVITIEESSATWSDLDDQLKRALKQTNVSIVINQRIESFATVVQVAKAGLLDGLAPLGIARSLAFPPDKTLDVFSGKLKRKTILPCR